ncbi:unnamed protein product [Mytilus coruscus]|uniref:Uncharacterized protein n=1 Tax=Mytilus coruscus TaxID=42192 RepID=A0A6J8DCH2_MYTCO|nr:unnamed protein product [Mytilus coruscus]
MCHSGSGKEEDSIGGLEVDSVALRMTTRQESCVCQVYLQNQTDKYTVNMQKYNSLTSAAPIHSDCGLVINVSLSNGIGTDKILETVECNNGTSFRPIMLKKKEKLNFKSVLIEGNYESGYCLQIFRNKAKTKNPSLQVACSQVTTNKTSNNQTITKDAVSTQYVIIGACVGAFVFLLTLVVVLMSTRRKRKKHSVIDSNNKEPTQMKSENDVGYDSEELKHNILYQTSEHCDITNGNYHTVELEERQVVNNTQNIDGDYISIDENFGTNRKNTPNPGSQPKCKAHITKEELGCKVEDVTPGTRNNVEYAVVNKTSRLEKHANSSDASNIEYAVVNKRDRLNENKEHVTSPNTEYTVVDESGRFDKNIKHVTPENGSNAEYAVVEKNTQV